MTLCTGYRLTILYALLVAVVTSAIASSSLASVNGGFADGLVAQYTLNNGHAIDSGFNELHGAAIRVTSAPNRFGKSDSALEFDRSASSYVIAPKPASLLDGSAITLAAWVKLADTFANMHAINNTSLAGGAAFSLTILGDGGCHAGGCDQPRRFGLELYMSWGQFSAAWSTVELTAGRWYHLAATYDGNQVVLYLNGAFESAFPLTGDFESNDLELNIGRFQAGNEHFNGIIDDAHVYNKALSPEEVHGLSRDKSPPERCRK
jgi:hypothetical protein